jgi:hypothetical protein
MQMTLSSHDTISDAPIFAPTSPSLSDVTTPSSKPTREGVQLLDDWIDLQESELHESCRTMPPSDDAVFELSAPDAHDAGVHLLHSIRRLLRSPKSPDFLEGFSDRLPEDMSDYVHPGSSYSMYVPGCISTNFAYVSTALRVAVRGRLVVYSRVPVSISSNTKPRWVSGRRRTAAS